MTLEFYEYESDLKQDVLIWIEEVRRGDWDKDESLDAIAIKLEEYK